MTFVIERVRVAAEFTTLSLLIWRRFGQPKAGLVEDTLDRNPGLSDLGLYLPVGTEFDLKVETESSERSVVQEAIRLW